MSLQDDAAAIVARLRAMAGPYKPNACDDAADIIERLIDKCDHLVREVANWQRAANEA